MRYYVKKRDLFNAVQWNGELTSDVLELLGERQFFVDGGLLILGHVERGWPVRVGDWIRVIGKEISAMSSDAFSSTCEEVDESGRPLSKTDAEQAASVADFVYELDALLLTGLKLTSAEHPGIFEERARLKRRLFRLLEEQTCTAATRERHRVREKIARDLTP